MVDKAALLNKGHVREALVAAGTRKALRVEQEAVAEGHGVGLDGTEQPFLREIRPRKNNDNKKLTIISSLHFEHLSPTETCWNFFSPSNSPCLSYTLAFNASVRSLCLGTVLVLI